MARNTKEQAQETRHQIINAAIDRFSEFGVAKTSLADIAAAAGVTRGAIYWHFKNKADLLNEIWSQSESVMADRELEYQAKYPSDPLSVMRALILSVFETSARDPKRRALLEIMYHKCEFVGEMEALRLMQQNFYQECYEKIGVVLKECIAADQLPENLDVARAAIVIRGYISGILENWLFMPESFDLVAEAPQLVDTLIDMLHYSPTLRSGNISG